MTLIANTNKSVSLQVILQSDWSQFSVPTNHSCCWDGRSGTLILHCTTLISTAGSPALQTHLPTYERDRESPNITLFQYSA